MANVVTNLGAGLVKFTFTDMDGDVFAHFRMNPADIKLYDRLKNIDAKVEELQKRFKSEEDDEDDEDDEETALKFNNAVEELFCYVVGYDIKDSLFSFMSATAIMPDGTAFYEKVLEVVQKEVGKEVEKREKKMQENIRKYTDKYKA